MTVAKTYISANQLLEDSFRLANQVHQAGFRPTHIVAIWRGGAPIGIAVQELLEFRGVHADHIAIRTSSYSDIGTQDPEVRVYALGHLVNTVNPDDALLIVDDVFDSGRSIKALIHELALKCRHNMPRTVKIATVYYKPKRNMTDLVPDFYLHEVDDWLVFPHELKGLTEDEIRTNKTGAHFILGE